MVELEMTRGDRSPYIGEKLSFSSSFLSSHETFLGNGGPGKKLALDAL
jgi:hypothetical protein